MREPPGGRAAAAGEGLGRRRDVVAVGRDVAGEDVEQQRRVGDVAGQRPVAAEAVEGLGVGPGGDAAALGLEADQVGPGGGDADRAGAVGAHRAGDQPGRDRGGGAAAGAARGVLEVPGVAGGAEGRGSRRSATGRPRARWSCRRSIAPAARRRRTASASRSAERCSPAQPKGVAWPARSTSSLIATGTPSSGARSPAARRRSASSASARACSAQTTRKALRVGWVASIRPSERSVSSRELTSPSASAPPARPARPGGSMGRCVVPGSTFRPIAGLLAGSRRRLHGDAGAAVGGEGDGTAGDALVAAVLRDQADPVEDRSAARSSSRRGRSWRRGSGGRRRRRGSTGRYRAGSRGSARGGRPRAPGRGRGGGGAGRSRG